MSARISHEADDAGDQACPRHCEFDADRVNLHNAYEVRWWCQRFVCTESMLRAAVAIVGVRGRDLEAYFRRRSCAQPKPGGRWRSRRRRAR
jgi:hypothetical protein